jgi:hypothetical protein
MTSSHPRHHCGRFHAPPVTRRDALRSLGGGFGMLAFAGLAGRTTLASDAADLLAERALAATHFPARARSVIFLYMDGGPSQVDTFDPKPRLVDLNGKPFPMKTAPTQFNNNGNTLASPWKFRRYGESGLPVSDLFPHIGGVADELCVIRSMTSEFSEHTNANYLLHTGAGIPGRPGMGAWCAYGLGDENANLPGFVVIEGGLIPPGGLDCFTAGFLPARHQGSIMRPVGEAIADATPREQLDAQARKRQLIARLDSAFAHETESEAVESAIKNHELAYRMQTAVPELASLDGESKETQELYGFDSSDPNTRHYARECCLARRLVERGVRFVEVTCPRTLGDRWDQHNDLTAGHEANAHAVDQPIAALIRDLKRRGLLESTLVVWAAEFGRTPFAQGSNGRDHNPFGFTVWMAGGGVKGGTVIGATDEFGYRAVEHPYKIHDLHATMLHLMGVDHRRLTFRFGGRDMRLTDVHGHLIEAAIA